MSSINSRAKEFFRRNQAQAMPEYTVVLAFVSSSSAFLLSQLGGRVTEVLTQVAGHLP
jgi:Flp pilus assembly pilin Flp